MLPPPSLSLSVSLTHILSLSRSLARSLLVEQPAEGGLDRRLLRQAQRLEDGPARHGGPALRQVRRLRQRQRLHWHWPCPSPSPSPSPRAGATSPSPSPSPRRSPRGRRRRRRRRRARLGLPGLLGEVHRVETLLPQARAVLQALQQRVGHVARRAGRQRGQQSPKRQRACACACACCSGRGSGSGGDSPRARGRGRAVLLKAVVAEHDGAAQHAQHLHGGEELVHLGAVDALLAGRAAER